MEVPKLFFFFFARGNAIGVMADRAKGMILDEKSDSGL